MREKTNTAKAIRVNYKAEHRTNKCEVCGTALTRDPKETTKAVRNYCPSCENYSKGVLISTIVSVQPPKPPTCLALKCLFRYFKDSLFCALLSSYHSRRVAYAEKNRHKKILDRYRSGEPCPETIWQAIHANLKLRCPICRKYNIDPLLFKGGL